MLQLKQYALLKELKKKYGYESAEIKQSEDKYLFDETRNSEIKLLEALLVLDVSREATELAADYMENLSDTPKDFFQGLTVLVATGIAGVEYNYELDKEAAMNALAYMQFLLDEAATNLVKQGLLPEDQ